MENIFRSNSTRVLGMALIALALNGCSARDEADGGSGADLLIGAANGTGAAKGEEGTGVVVDLRFTDSAYTGYWLDKDRSTNLTPEIVRLTYGERYFHIEYFLDKSVGSGTDGQNCYGRNGLSLTNKNGAGLRGAADVDKLTDYREWTLNGDKLQSTIYDPDGEVVANSTGTATFTRIWEGHSASDLQECDS